MASPTIAPRSGATPATVHPQSPAAAARLALVVLSGYITFPAARYRHPIEPLMLMLAVLAVVNSIPKQGRASQK